MAKLKLTCQVPYGRNNEWVCMAPAKAKLVTATGTVYMCGVCARSHDHKQKNHIKTIKLER